MFCHNTFNEAIGNLGPFVRVNGDSADSSIRRLNNQDMNHFQSAKSYQKKASPLRGEGRGSCSS